MFLHCRAVQEIQKDIAIRVVIWVIRACPVFQQDSMELQPNHGAERMDRRQDTAVEAILEQLIETGPGDLADTPAGTVNVQVPKTAGHKGEPFCPQSLERGQRPVREDAPPP